jgi:two-component system LytT family sensor kinase
MLQTRRTIFRLIMGTLTGWLGFTYIFYSEQGNMPAYSQHWQALLLVLLSMNIAVFVISLLRKQLNTWFPWHKGITLRFIGGVVGNALLALFIFALATLLYILLFTSIKSFSGFAILYTDASIKLMIITLIVVFIYTIIDFTLFSYNAYAEVQIESVKLTQAQLALQLQILKNQLSPHFLFNSLNTISSLIHRDAAVAEKFIRKLSLTYQYIIATQGQALVTLAEELNFLQAYVFLLKSRFEEALEVTITLPAHVMQSRIPPLTLQLLLENAVKHNIVSDETPLQINIYLDVNEWITVSNTIQENLNPNPSFKIGLDNIIKRYQFQTDKMVEVSKGQLFTVKLPLLPASQPVLIERDIVYG